MGDGSAVERGGWVSGGVGSDVECGGEGGGGGGVGGGGGGRERGCVPVVESDKTETEQVGSKEKQSPNGPRKRRRLELKPTVGGSEKVFI